MVVDVCLDQLATRVFERVVDDKFWLPRSQGQALRQAVPVAQSRLRNFMGELDPVRPLPDRPLTGVDDLVAMSPAVVVFLGFFDNAYADPQESLSAIVIP